MDSAKGSALGSQIEVYLQHRGDQERDPDRRAGITIRETILNRSGDDLLF